jgi:ubiquinone/menaquinone biosynthesis C-methylase UbiE
MDKPMSNLGFWGMSVLFRIRDFLLPRKRLLNEAGIFPGARVLDYGCGPGSYSLAVAELVGETGKVVALDIHPMAMEAVHRKAAKRGLTNIERICAADPSGVESESIEVVLLYDTFHMLGDQDGVLKELHRVLTLDGVLSFSDHHMKDAEIVTNVTAGGLFELAERGKYTYRFVKTSAAGR